MRYLTKGWYLAMQGMDRHCLMKIDERAGTLSESFFQEVYRNAENKWLRARQQVSRLLNTPVDEEKEKSRYHEMFVSGIARYEAILPEHIRSQIPDIRVLSLGFCTEKIRKLLEDLSAENKSYVERMAKQCTAAQRASFEGADDTLLNRFDFHDEQVLSFGPRDRDWVIDFGEYAGLYSQVRYLRFKNAVILTLDGDLADARWLYEELYKTETGYELHILLDKNGLMECILTCDDILLEGERSWC